MTETPSSPAPGWYPDPGGEGQVRYWDGSAWTGSTQPAPAAGSSPATADPGAPAPVDPGAPGYGAAPAYGAPAGYPPAPGYGAAPGYGVPPGYPPAPGYGGYAGYGGYPLTPGAKPRAIGFVEALQRGFRGYVDFTGRATRSEYWFWTLGVGIVLFVLLLLDIGTRSVFFGLLLALGYLAVLLPSIAVAVRRLHDSDKSGWMYLLGFIPFVGGIILIVLFCIESTPGPNRHGPLTV